MLRILFSIVALCTFVVAPALVSAQSASSRPTGKEQSRAAAALDLNTATAKDLETLPGIGEKTAARIVEYRQKNGPFRKIEELMNVGGIGEKMFLALRPQITVTPPKTVPAGQQNR